GMAAVRRGENVNAACCPHAAFGGHLPFVEDKMSKNRISRPDADDNGHKDDPSADDGSSGSVLDLATKYVAAGLSVVPVKTDGSKAPALRTWKWLERQLPSAADLGEWFHRPDPPGVAIICGAVSGNLELIDFDVEAETIYPAWCALVELERPGL